MSFAKRTMSALGVLCLLIFAPVTVRPGNLMAEGPGAVVRLNDACGQATSCVYMRNYICSTFDGNVVNYNCNTGCEPTQPLPPAGG